MSKGTTPNGKKVAHRPLKHIDWELVDEFLLAGCTGTEIASHFDMHPETFYDRVAAEKGTGFTDYSSQKRCKGQSILRYAQYKKAIGATDKGDNTLLIWLGKQRLNQKEANDISVTPETMTAYLGMMKQLDEVQQERKQQKNPSDNIKVTVRGSSSDNS